MYKLTISSPGYCIASSTSLPRPTEVSLGGAIMLIVCAKHVVAKAASNAATVYFILVVVMTIGESLELVDSNSYIYKSWISLRMK